METIRRFWRNLKLFAYAWGQGFRAGRATARVLISQRRLQWKIDEIYERAKAEGNVT